MRHEAYFRISAEHDTAILFIHGIIGTPDHFTDFVKMVPENVSVVNILLDGHGKGVEDFAASSMKKWKKQVSDCVERLCETHRRIIIAAHSMGTLFAIQQAIAYPDKITYLFLISTPLELFIKPEMISNALKVYSGRIKPDDAKGMAAKNAYGIGADKRFWKYLGWLPRYSELFAEIKLTRKLVTELRTSCDIYLSKKDELVSANTEKILKSCGIENVHVLQNSGHIYYDDADYAFMLDEFGKKVLDRQIQSLDTTP